MSLPVAKPDRRRAPRARLNGLAYIIFEPDNGGIVLNVSDEGLCFHSVAPVQRSEVIRFWFSAKGRRIGAEGRLAWTDEQRKTGGLRFNALSAEAQEQIRNWIAQSTRSPAERHVALAPPPNAFDNSTASTISPAHLAMGRAFLPQVGAPTRWAVFFRGLATGLLIGVVAASALLFHTYRRQFGESLIRLGERFAATQEPRVVSPASKSVPASVLGAPVPWPTIVPAPAQIPTPHVEKVLPEPMTKAVTSSRAELKPDTSAPATSPVSPREPFPSTAPAAASPSIPAEPGKVVQPESADDPRSKPKVLTLERASHFGENTEYLAELNSGVPLGKYFEVGRFKEEQRANKATNDLAHIGFRATIIPKNLLWMKSYEVLVGPYSNEGDAQAARSSLQSQGFRPRSLATMSRQFRLAPLSETEVVWRRSTEDFIVTWEPYGTDATVKFVKAGATVATAEGRWVKQPVKNAVTAIRYTKNDDGSRTLLEIQFLGMSQIMVLPTTSGNAIIF